jgi:AcrR family transcriptional regulator
VTAEDQGNQRRRPKQARSRATREAIVEATSQIIERSGPGGLTTNAVAERAGVSIGTLYQYFADKRALLIAAAERELAHGGEIASRRQRALIKAMASMLESLGGMGAAASGSRNPRASRAPSKPRGAGWERRLLDLAQDWLGELAAPPLQPIPIRPRTGLSR